MSQSRICAATGKRIYKRHQDAGKAIGQLRKHDGNGLAQMPQTAYQCVACRRWHLTSESPADVRHYRSIQRLRRTPSEATG